MYRLLPQVVQNLWDFFLVWKAYEEMFSNPRNTSTGVSVKVYLVYKGRPDGCGKGTGTYPCGRLRLCEWDIQVDIHFCVGVRRGFIG